MKFNYCKIKGLVYYHRQIERRNGRIFMRMKKRPLCIVKFE
ncbi:hypothetical protein ACFLYT_01620 [Nanoarchaeota archaeon]